MMVFIAWMLYTEIIIFSCKITNKKQNYKK